MKAEKKTFFCQLNVRQLNFRQLNLHQFNLCQFSVRNFPDYQVNFR